MTHGSISTGIGGFDLGAEQNGIKTLWTCEIDPLRQDILRYYYSNAKHNGDIRKIKKLRYVDIVSFGFPCQDISSANPYGEGIQGEESRLWFEGWRIIRTVGPRYILLENSPNLVHKGLGAILWQLSEAGYNAEWQIISCKQFGLPHLRKRLFIVAYSQKIGLDPVKVFKQNDSKKHQAQRAEKVRELEVRFRPGGSSGILSWDEIVPQFLAMDDGIPDNIFQGLLAAAGDTVSPRITSWIFGRIKEAAKK